MTAPVPDTKAPGTRWMWVAVIVLLAVVFIGFLLFGSRADAPETIPDYAVTTQEERLNQDLPLATDEDLPAIRGAEVDTMIEAEGGEVEVVTDTETAEAQ
ncbi:hypothetical protein [Erythrobacter sp. SD-21]|uniref:hypothetical protein n=1 Tax=Erythrobacter sp. SD-21 TaxID=161528 RepID=UPI000153F478|nr:hypothetical protein [Erythrobacter sp. SD-21]EDL49574.1 hypothetical protein ED21_18287 [Erythrobacter sp. SD-21]